ncbi:MAG: ATPase V [Bacteroidaceae bacterium]|nr:ATPase V [Bacteroidaceae bacterium]
MITKMKKITALVFHREYEQFLTDLQHLGVVHVQPAQEGNVAPDSQLQAELNRVNEVQAAIEALKPMAAVPVPSGTGSSTASAGEAAFSSYTELMAQQQNLNAQLSTLNAQLSQVALWGDFDLAAVNDLVAIGYEMSFFTALPKVYKKQESAWNTDSRFVFPVNQTKDDIYFVVVAPQGTVAELEGATRVAAPTTTVTPCRQELEAVNAQLSTLNAQLATLATEHLADLRVYEADLRSHVQFDQAKLDTTRVADDTVMILEGWTPIGKVQEVDRFLRNSGVCYEMRDPVKGDNVPILLRNNAFTRMYEVLTGMYGMPDYNEFDPTPIVAPFFTLFFSYCIADAGYGLVLVLLGFLLKAKLGPSMKGMMNLVITLGIATTILGAVFGTFFGVNLTTLDLPEWMQGLMITGKVGDTVYDKTMLLSLAIGVVHLIIAMTVKAIKSTVLYGFKQSITPWSWLLLIVGAIAIFGLQWMKVISTDVSAVAFYVVGGIAALGIFLLNDLKRNPLLNIGAGLWDTYGMASGLLGDVLSYVRIYALGLAGGMLGGVFNQLAMMVKGDAWWGWIPCILILVFGHTLNIAMSCLGAFVHPLRLNFVEYFKNSNYEGSGTAYEPLRIVQTAE